MLVRRRPYQRRFTPQQTSFLCKESPKYAEVANPGLSLTGKMTWLHMLAASEYLQSGQLKLLSVTSWRFIE